MTRAIAIVLFPNAEELDFVGPWEVLTMLKSLDASTCDVFTVSEHGGVIRCAKGLQVVAEHSFATAPRADIILVPGGRGVIEQAENPAMIEYLRRAGERAEVSTSVCTGAFLLERSGLLQGRRATTHWASLDYLRGLGTVEVVEERWVDEGPVITASGVSAGIDMTLHLVGRLWGPDTARRVQKAIEYFPAPPYADVPVPEKVW